MIHYYQKIFISINKVQKWFKTKFFDSLKKNSLDKIQTSLSSKYIYFNKYNLLIRIDGVLSGKFKCKYLLIIKK